MKSIALDKSKLLGFRICRDSKSTRMASKVGAKRRPPVRIGSKVGTPKRQPVRIGSKVGVKRA
jgi:hypothetical protein